MRINKLVIFSLALCCMLLFGCAKKSDTNLGEARLIIPTYTVKAPAKGKILGLIIEKGEHIGKDQPLFAIGNSDVDAKVKSVEEELIKAETELKRLETGSTVQVSAGDLSAAQERVRKAEANAAKMNNLLAVGAVSRKQAQQAEAELVTARGNLSALTGQSERLKASPEAISKQKTIVENLKASKSKALADQSAFEANSPNSSIVIEKFANNGDEVEKNQEVLKLLAQDECEVKIKLSTNVIEKLKNQKATLVFKEKGKDVVFTGKIVRLEGDTIIVWVKLPTSIAKDINVQISIQE